MEQLDLTDKERKLKEVSDMRKNIREREGCFLTNERTNERTNELTHKPKHSLVILTLSSTCVSVSCDMDVGGRGWCRG